MEANVAPERIWIDLATDLPNLSGHIDKDSIEYTRTDAFIEKACEWLEPVLKNYAGHYAGTDILGDFRKYMKGE